MDLQGEIIVLGETKEFGSNGFRKREIVIKTEDQYPQEVLIEFVQDKCDVLNNYKVGDNVSIGLNIRGRSWVSPQGETKYFNSLQGWKIDKAQGSAGGQQAPPPDNFEPASDLNEEDYDDLPF